MRFITSSCFIVLSVILLLIISLGATGQKVKPAKVIGFYTAKEDLAHISFVHEANQWFAETGKRYGFSYDSTNDWNNLTDTFLQHYQLVIFLDTRPDYLPQRKAFEKYMKQGGAWMGFHFAAFALDQSAVPQNWDWYHQQFLGAGQYKSNTWHPTAAVLRVETTSTAFTVQLPEKIKAAPNEWYCWENNFRKNPSIKVLLSVDSSSFPLGNGPKPSEIWHSGDYPVVWTNMQYRMIYFNMGHNDMDYDGGSNRQLSSTFSEPLQNKLFINALQYLLGL